jgi:4-hydroxy-tetrahydrodipicolinate reductase
MPVLGIIGANGRLGSAVRAAATAGGWEVGLTADRGGWTVRTTPDVVVDASHRSALADVAGYCIDHGVPLVSTTSGLTGDDHAALGASARAVAVVRAPNLALGHLLQRTLLEGLAQHLAGVLERGAAELTVAERHPTTKLDRPSATALVLAATWRAATGTEPASVDAVRGGLGVSDHAVTLTLGDEELVISHSVRSLTAPARRALEAAAWAWTAPPGLYGMADVDHVTASALPTSTSSTRR